MLKNHSKLNRDINFAYFGGGTLSILVLEELKKEGFRPNLIITTPDKPKGRDLISTPPETKVWAEQQNIPYIQPESLKDFNSKEIESEIKKYFKNNIDVFVVVSYGKIIPKNILSLPLHGTLNVHPSLLPKLRGPSPIKSAILEEDETGVTIINLDLEIDHGPIVFQEKIEVEEWPPYEEELERKLGKLGGKILSEILPKWIEGLIKEIEQDHSKATYSKKIKKQDGEINFDDSPEKNLRKIRSFHRWPSTFFFDKNNKRIIVKRAKIENGKLTLERIIPEGKKEMNYNDYLKGTK